MRERLRTDVPAKQILVFSLMDHMRNLTEIRSFLAVLLLASGPSLCWADDDTSPDFARDVQPILKARCYSCHDQRKKTAGLRLDVRSSALRGGDSGKKAIVPRHAADAELIKRVISTVDEEVMPPSGPKLTPQQIAILRQWIDGGASWPDALAGEPKSTHWAFVAPVRPILPAAVKGVSSSNPIDRFIQARLAQGGMAPAPEAERTTLLRRLSLDLIGLPPSLDEISAFLADKSPKAFEHVVDRLLASPHYGERWARVWLDGARYADSDGFEKDKSRQVWFYRDWVINALNKDMPYNQFLIEQIAGDLLSNATQDQKVATGFLRNSMINEEGGVHPEQFRMEAMFDRMDAIGKSMLGLTIQCAQCHNHKYDPLSQLDYYRLFACINDDHEACMAVYSPAEQSQIAELYRGIQTIETELQHRSPDWRQRMYAWEDKVRNDQPVWQVIQPSVDDLSTGGEKYLLQPDGSFLALGYAPTKHTVKLMLNAKVKGVTAFRLELLNDPNLPLGGPGRSIKGTGALSEFRVESAPVKEPGKSQNLQIARATADVNPPVRPLEAIFSDRSNRQRTTGPIELAIDGNNDTAWAFDVGAVRRNLPRKAVFTLDKPIDGAEEQSLTFFITQNHGGWNSDDNQNCNLGRIRLSMTTTPGASADPLPDRVRKLVARGHEHRSAAEDQEVFHYWRETMPEWKEANEQIEKLWQQHPDGSSQLVLEQRTMLRPTHLLKRGDFLQPAQVVSAGVPDFLHAMPKTSAPARLEFARWLADPKSPTTARSIVNRIWQSYFGTGLVSTSEDLGTQAEAPSHPELLDWLAVEFMERGWSLKDLQRMIVCSSTYQQSSKVTPEGLARDPYNRLLARGPRFRVDAEIVRDVALAASGLMDEKVGGRSVFPPLPGFMLMPPVSYGPKIWPVEEGPDRYRRALYTFRYRSLPYPGLQAFDAPNGDASCVRRTRSNTPLQALTTLNEPVFLDCARHLAAETLNAECRTDSERVNYAFRKCTGRTPTEPETRELLRLLHEQEVHFAQPSAKPAELVKADLNLGAAAPAVALPRLAAWTIVARVLLNLDETITKE
jgi:hypothetical protein